MPFKPIEWIWTPGVFKTTRDNDPNDHGSCVASKAIGFVNGVSKNSRLVIVKASHTVADTEWAFAKIYDDIIQQRRAKSSVILFARSSIEIYSNQSPLPVYWKNVRRLMMDQSALGVHIVTSAGNDGKRSISFDTIPAIWHETLPLIVVGAVSVRAGLADFTQGRFLDDGLVYAPGVNVSCAGGNSASGMQSVNGTSVAAAMVRLRYGWRRMELWKLR